MFPRGTGFLTFEIFEIFQIFWSSILVQKRGVNRAKLSHALRQGLIDKELQLFRFLKTMFFSKNILPLSNF